MLNTMEKVQVATNVIEGLGIKDEDLQQEIYLRAIQFKDGERAGCTRCVNQQTCLFDDLSNFAKYYLIKENQINEREIKISSSLERIDDAIISYFMHIFNM